MTILQHGMVGSAGGYQIDNSLRFRSSASAYLNRTPASAGNRKTWTWSGWVKKSAIVDDGNDVPLFSAVGASVYYDSIRFNSNSTFYVYYSGGFGYSVSLASGRVFRDPSAWCHVAVAQDTTQSTESLRLRIWINGEQQTLTGIPAQNYESGFNNSVEHHIGKQYSQAQYFNGYLSEINFIDGQALTPASFGETNTDGVWVPKAYTGTYGTNGFYLKFNNATSTTTLGYDSSGNSNNWTCNNISLTSGVTYDSMTDTPTNNYCVLNPLNASISDLNVSLTYGNLRASGSSYGATVYSCTFPVPQSEKWYYEITHSTLGSTGFIGIRSYLTSSTDIQYLSTGSKSVGGATTAYGASWTVGDVIGVAIDKDGGTVTFYKNGVSQGLIVIPISSATFDMAVNYSSPWNFTSFDANFGQRPFAFSPPTGFKALCTANLPEVAITSPKKHFDVSLYSGNTTTVTATNGGFQPDLVWIKDRSQAASHVLTDSVRGTSAQLFSNLTNAEQSNSTYVTAFNSNGFTVGVGNSGTGVVNNSGDAFVGWLWKANGSGVTNTDGSITSTVSANQTAGFSIVTYTGTGATATVGHGLGVAPKMVVCKNRSVNAEWYVYHASLGTNKAIFLEQTAAASTSNLWWNNTAPTTNVFSLGDQTGNNGSGNNIVAYCFSEIAGYSKFGSYTGNGSTDGPFVYCGFRPRWILIKDYYNPAGNNNWVIFDTARDSYNVCGNLLRPNISDAELYSPPRIDILSNGFKVRIGGGLPNDASGTNYIFAAFAEMPSGGSNVSPSPAR